MTPRIRVHTIALVALVALAAAWRQATIGPSDLARLESTAADVERQIQTVGKTDSSLADQSTKSLADLRDEIAYLRVKLRRDGSVSAAEYAEVRDRLETLRVRLQNATRVSAQPIVPDDPMKTGVLPVGTEIDVRLQTPLSSRTARVEQRFEATTILDVQQGRDVIVPAGSVVRGFVSSVRSAGRIDRTGSLTLSFDELAIEGRVSKLRASISKALDPSVSQDATRIGAGAAVGAVLGGILGGGKGALLGVLIGGGGTIASTEGSDVDLPVGTVLRIRLDEPLDTSFR
jgi:hypothetical protein